jgi:tol-pal system protein YbgF
MTILTHHLRTAVFAACVLVAAGAAQAQDRDSSPGLLDNLFSRGEPQQRPSQQPSAADPGELSVRIDRLENQLRQLTGTIEQLQFRNQQLEQEIVRMQGGNAPAAGARPMPGPSAAPPVNVPPPVTSGRRSDAFDPSQNPNAVGAPRALGGGSAPLASAGPDIPIGAAGGRASGAPLDLSGNVAAPQSLGTAPSTDTLPPPPPRNPSATGRQVATLPPSASPKDQLDLGVGYVEHKDYASAEQTLRDFLKKNPNDRLAPDAHYWLGESLYRSAASMKGTQARDRYQDAADSYLVVVRNYESSPKAPEALLRLGQSLAALGQKEMACASLNELSRKYPRASANVKREVAQEQKRGHC